MSDRPTISIYADDHLIVCYYMRNWPMESLFVECARIVRAIGNASNRDAVLALLDAKRQEDHDETEMRRLETCSEYPVVIDLTRKMTYLKDDYPLGYPEQDALPIASVNDYRQACSPFVIWPPERPITFDALVRVADELLKEAPDGAAVAKSRGYFIEHLLPDIVSEIFSDAE